MDLLQRTGWRVRLDLAADVLPCCIQLFCPALLADLQLLLGQQAELALPAASAAAHQEWATALRQLCAIIREKVSAGFGWEWSLHALQAKQLFSCATHLHGWKKGLHRRQPALNPNQWPPIRSPAGSRRTSRRRTRRACRPPSLKMRLNARPSGGAPQAALERLASHPPPQDGAAGIACFPCSSSTHSWRAES